MAGSAGPGFEGAPDRAVGDRGARAGLINGQASIAGIAGQPGTGVSKVSARVLVVHHERKCTTARALSSSGHVVLAYPCQG